MGIRPLIETSAGAGVLFLSLFVLWCASELFGPARWHGSQQSLKRDQGSTWFTALASTIGTILFVVFPLCVSATIVQTNQEWLFALGIGLVGIGGVLRWYAIRTLGSWFTGSIVIQGGQPLIQNGVYRWIRHPSYTGILLIVLGFGCMTTDWASCLAIFGGLFIGLWYRMKVEERVMGEAFSQYEEYQRKTKRLVPFLF